MTAQSFPAQIQELDGEFLVRFPDVPEALTGGTTRAEALAQAPDALATALEGYLDAGIPIPSPSPAADDLELIDVPADVADRIAQAA